MKIPWNLEATPLQIKTNSTLGSDKTIRLAMGQKESNYIGLVQVKFSSTVQYEIGYCANDWTDLPVQPPVEVEKIWKITKTETAFIITCNNVEVLNYLFAGISAGGKCVPRWGGDVVGRIWFRVTDTASDCYRAGEGNLTIKNYGDKGHFSHIKLHIMAHGVGSKLIWIFIVLSLN